MVLHLEEAEFLKGMTDLSETNDTNNLPVIMMYQDRDGNWKGGMRKNGAFVHARDIGPETVLQLLLTHDGK